eukprot:TRINITY_DN16197_c0_g1_i2.p1 TRINITY_DN16197_c0_g1~~TRINITY_DN16197_c0_g1_i2.p1  ORF type:complete len:390 (+),score=47.41 TRINITY_DN16197_c0_g1_i2:161-1171(+)
MSRKTKYLTAISKFPNLFRNFIEVDKKNIERKCASIAFVFATVTSLGCFFAYYLSLPAVVSTNGVMSRESISANSFPVSGLTALSSLAFIFCSNLSQSIQDPDCDGEAIAIPIDVLPNKYLCREKSVIDRFDFLIEFGELELLEEWGLFTGMPGHAHATFYFDGAVAFADYLVSSVSFNLSYSKLNLTAISTHNCSEFSLGKSIWCWKDYAGTPIINFPDQVWTDYLNANQNDRAHLFIQQCEEMFEYVDKYKLLSYLTQVSTTHYRSVFESFTLALAANQIVYRILRWLIGCFLDRRLKDTTLLSQLVTTSTQVSPSAQRISSGNLEVSSIEKYV